MARRPGRGLRIIAGEHRGRRLGTPPGKILRPMRDQVRGALFNILGPERVAESVTLDLFAGSGSLGLEALSRGAPRAVFVDINPRCLEVLRQNVTDLNLDERANVRRHDLARGVTTLVSSGPFDLVIVHPPFELLRRPPQAHEPDVTRLLGQLANTEGLLAADARIAFETPAECYRAAADLPFLEVLLRREYGTTALFVTASAVTGGVAGA